MVSDYKPRKDVDKNNLISALSYLSLEIRYKIAGDSIYCYLEPYLIKNLSWMIRTDSDSLTLEHEQVHFDICEYSARCIRSVLSQKNFKSLKQFKRNMNRLHKKYARIAKKLNHTYDKDTDYSRNKEQQYYWQNRRIKEFLDSKSLYSDPNILIIVR